MRLVPHGHRTSLSDTRPNPDVSDSGSLAESAGKRFRYLTDTDLWWAITPLLQFQRWVLTGLFTTTMSITGIPVITVLQQSWALRTDEAASRRLHLKTASKRPHHLMSLQ